jgi:hypothetical protein
MNNKTLPILCLFVFMMLLFNVDGYAKEKTVASLWSDSPLLIDASNDDWTDSTLHFEKKVKVDCAFKNDLHNLYVLIVFKDLEYLSSIQATGMTLWFSTVKKKKKDYGINFKVKMVSAEDLIAILEKQKGPLPDEEKARLKSSPQYALFRGDVIDKKENVITASVLTGDMMEPTYRSVKQQDMVIYELRLPLKIFGELSDNLKMEPGTAVKVGFEWGGLTKAMKQARISSIAASQERDAERTSESSTRRTAGGRSSFQGGSSRRPPKKYSFWLDVQLAQK